MANFVCGKSVSDTFRKKSEADLMSMFPSILTDGKLDEIRIGAESKYKVSASEQRAGMYAAQHDSMPRSYWQNDRMQRGEVSRPLIRMEVDPQVALQTKANVDSLVSTGKTVEQAKAIVAREIDPVMVYDAAANQYVVKAHLKGVNDSILTSSAIPYWNIGILNKIFKQPYTASKASRLVSTESFGNAWCDMVMVFKEAFEGYARISNTSMGDVEQTNSSPVLNKFGTIMSRIYNIAIDYDSSIAEDIAAGAGSPLIAQGIGDREQYASMVMERIKDQLTYFGDDETGFTGLLQSCTPVTYSGTPFNTTYEGSSTTKGSDIVRSYIALIADFMQANHYMSSAIQINVSTYVYKALTSTVYSDTYNPSSPMEIIKAHFANGEDLGGGMVKLAVNFAVDTMLDPTVSGGIQNPFNDNAYDLMFITVPSVNSAMGEQKGLVIRPEPLKTFVVPPIQSRQGRLYTQYSRIGGLIVPIDGTVACYKGIGYQG